jgi:hypothetical protein
MAEPNELRDLLPKDLQELGYGQKMAERIVDLLGQEMLLERYLRLGALRNCIPLTRITPRISRCGPQTAGVGRAGLSVV